jgi:hypothetical protein
MFLFLGVVGAGFWAGSAFLRRHHEELWELHRLRKSQLLSRLERHPFDQRKRELEALIADLERGESLTREDVGSRLGRPDEIEETGSKDYGDRVILTTYRYSLATGDYLFPNSERADIGTGASACFYFDERVKHGRGGRVYSVVDETVPVESILIYSRETGQPRFEFRTHKR